MPRAGLREAGPGWGFAAQYPRPENYTLNGIDPFEAFESTTGWTLSNATITQDDTHAVYGHAIKFVNTGNVASMAKSLTPVVTPTGLFRLHLYIEDKSKLTTGQAVYLYIDSTTNQTKYAEFKITGTKLINGWQWIDMPLGSFTLGGGEAWSNNRIKLTLLFAYVSGQTTNIWIDTLQYIESTRPKVVLTFDDGMTALYNYALPSLDRYGLRATIYVPPTSVGDANYMTVEQLQVLMNRGYGIGGHAYNHVNLTTLADEAAVQANIEQMIAWFVANDLTLNDQHLHMAYPYGAYNAVTYVVPGVSAAGIKTARITGAGYQYPVFDPAPVVTLTGKALTMPIGYALDASGSYAGAVAAITAAHAVGASIIIMGHDIVSGTPTGNQFGAADFEQLCAYLYAGRATWDVETITQFYDGFSTAPIV